MKKLAFLLTTCALMACESDGLVINFTERQTVIEHQPTSELESLLPKRTQRCCGDRVCCGSTGCCYMTYSEAEACGNWCVPPVITFLMCLGIVLS